MGLCRRFATIFYVQLVYHAYADPERTYILHRCIIMHGVLMKTGRLGWDPKFPVAHVWLVQEHQCRC